MQQREGVCDYCEGAAGAIYTLLQGSERAKLRFSAFASVATILRKSIKEEVSAGDCDTLQVSSIPSTESFGLLAWQI